MISRDTAAFVRFHVLVKKLPIGSVAASNRLSVAQVQRILDNDLVPAPERYVVQPSYTLRSRKLSPEQRMDIANLICFGATLRRLSDDFGVQIRAIQHIKETLTISADQARSPQKREIGHLSFNAVAEARYDHYHNKQPVSLISAKLFVNYKTLHGAVAFRTYRPAHRRRPKPILRIEGDREKQAFWLYIYGADMDFIRESTGIESERVNQLLDNNSEVAR